MNKEYERRSFFVEEFRADDGETPKMTGYAALFENLSEDLGGFREKIAHGAFSKTLGGDVRALFNHDPNYILGRTVSKTLRLKEDQRGLAIEIDPPNTTVARDLQESVKRGDVSQMSFGFKTISDKWENTKEGTIRTILEAELFDISPVTFPAYRQTEVALRSLNAWQKENETPPDYSLYRAKERLAQL